jgi:hypothetical protein
MIKSAFRKSVTTIVVVKDDNGVGINNQGLRSIKRRGARPWKWEKPWERIKN